MTSPLERDNLCVSLCPAAVSYAALKKMLIGCWTKMLELDRKQIDPLKLLQLIVDEEIPAVSSSGKEFKVELPSTLSSVWADGSRLRQVLINLMDNAMKVWAWPYARR